MSCSCLFLKHPSNPWALHGRFPGPRPVKQFLWPNSATSEGFGSLAPSVALPHPGHGSSSEGPWPGRPEALDLSKPGVATVPAGWGRWIRWDSF